MRGGVGPASDDSFVLLYATSRWITEMNNG